MSVQQIITTLENLEKMHKSLLELAYKKTEIVKKGDMEELDVMLKNEQSHVAAIGTLEQQRQVLVQDYLNAKGIATTGTPTVLDVIEVAESEIERKQLEEVRKRLMLVIDDLRKQNDLNQKLIFQSLKFVNMTLDLLRPQPSQINYSGDQTRNAVPKNSSFDSQA
ncbi:flagellar protein FlgN [Lysinibacillus endophyticus]|uniref:flagellar protein FlgN n=1 Tax=Ureibacillus endophyticus TaxID=1978490 RepID=UPI00209F1F17|nr:flagellar protein FlgN [Lysinibacillus endophyticus]MCP1143734.1 flagellar protein FlgN [Lysinibacillus endophyticus]